MRSWRRFGGSRARRRWDRGKFCCRLNACVGMWAFRNLR